MTDFKSQSPIAVANFIIDHSKEAGTPVSNLQLQKILYFLQAAFLVKNNGIPLFDGKFSRWGYGPVMQEVYNAYRDNGSSSIVDFAPNISIDNGNWNIKAPEKLAPEELDPEDCKLLVNTIDKLLGKNPWELVELTHKQPIWSDHENEIINHTAPDYENSEIFKYFKNDEGARIWQQG